ncbi:MAG: (Fe-S)-binding protein [Deltaproteobacteria bacterium]|nr:(Fe-S)-binding protein [Deltaproteobacteria bacterium]
MYPEKVMIQEAEKCSRCGVCAAVCPVFRELQRETYSSRGKTEIAKALVAGELPYSSYTEDIFSKCLLCLTCKGACPAGVDQGKLILGIRAELAKRRGLPLSKKIAFKYLLKNRSLFEKALKAFSYLQMFAPPKGDGQLRHLPFFLSAFGKRRLIPDLSKTPLRKEFPEVIPPSKAPAQMRAGLFSGCFIDFVDPAIGRSLIRVLGRHGVEVVFPKKQTCCGIPVFMSGDLQNGLDLLKMNIEAFAAHELDAVITACATCGTALKESYKVLVEGESQEWKDRVAAFSAKTMDIAEFLTRKIKLTKPEKATLIKVTYHDPCHLNRGQGVLSQPREVLKNLPGITLVEMRDAQRCCGGGGSFSFYNYDLSQQISRQKVEDIQATKASVVVTGCPGCMLQLKDQLGQKNSQVEVKHLIQLVDEAGS